MADYRQPPTQQPPAPQQHGQPQPLPPAHAAAQGERQHVHHSYIWLSSIQVIITLVVIAAFSALSSIGGALASGEALSGSDFGTLVAIVASMVVGLVVLAGIIVLFQWLAYKNLYYELGPDEFSRYSGILSKKRVHVPYQRIQSVDQRASLLQRIFGVCTVNIDTAGGAANKAISVPYVQKDRAEQLRRELFARKQYVVAVQSGAAPAEAAAAAAAVAGVNPAAIAGDPSAPFAPAGMAGGMPAVPAAAAVPGASQAPHNVLDAPAEIWQDVRGVFGGMAVDTGRVTYEYGLSNKELLFTGLSNNTALVLVVVGIVGGVAQLVRQLVSLPTGEPASLVGNVMNWVVQLFGGNVIAAVAALLLVLTAIIWVLSIIGMIISFGGFRACRRDSRIEVERGLLQHVHHSVDIDRVQSVIVKQSFIRRLLGYCELSLGKVDAAAEGSDEQQQSSLSKGLVVHPFVKMDRVPAILAGLVPEFADVPVDSTPVAPVALRRALVRRGIIQGSGFWLAVCFAIAQVCFNLFSNPADAQQMANLDLVNAGAPIGYAVCATLFVIDLIAAVLWFRGSGFAYNKRFMQVSNGGFSRETVSFPRRKIQFGYTKTNPFQRRARTATVNARTAAGVGGTTIRLIDVCEEDARVWLDWLRPKGNVIQ